MTGSLRISLTTCDHLVAPGHRLQLIHGVWLDRSIAIHRTDIGCRIDLILGAVRIRQGLALIALDGRGYGRQK